LTKKLPIDGDQGIYDLSAYEGGLTRKRRARLKALGAQIEEKV
jgi:hypothetical protein